MHLEFPGILCTLHQTATLVAEKAHEQTPQKPNGRKVVWNEKKGTATKDLHEQKIDTSRVYNIQHIILTDSPKNAINSQENLTRCARKPRNPKDFSQISMGNYFLKYPENYFLKYPWKSFKFLAFLQHPTYKLDRFPPNCLNSFQGNLTRCTRNPIIPRNFLHPSKTRARAHRPPSVAANTVPKKCETWRSYRIKFLNSYRN